MNNYYIGVLLGAAVIGVVCAVIAHKKNRCTVGWLFLGFAFGVIPLIIIACLSPKYDCEYSGQDYEYKRLLLEEERIKLEQSRLELQKKN